MDEQLGWFEETAPTTDAVRQLDILCESYEQARENADEAKEKLSACNVVVDEFEKKIISILEAHKKTSWDANGKKFIVVTRMAVTTPKDPDAKAAFFSYLKDKGIFEDMATVNYQTLNGFFKQELESALDRGETDFSIPGIGQATYSSGLTMKKGK